VTSPPAPQREARPKNAPPPARKPAARSHKTEPVAIEADTNTTTEADVEAQELRAPVRDAVALPPLRSLGRDRPDRERSARPGYEE
jgi:hypothetical protein